MSGPGITALRVERSGLTALRDGDADLFFPRDDAAGWQRLRALAAGQRRLTVRVPEWATLPLTLPKVPSHPRELQGMLRQSAPVLPSALAWTAARPQPGGGAGTVVVRRDWLDERIGPIEEALGITPRLIVEPSGEPLRYRSVLERRRNGVTGLIVSASLLVAAAAGLIAAQRADDAGLVLPESAAPVARAPGIADTLLSLGPVMTPAARLLAIAADAGGTVRVSFAAGDQSSLSALLPGFAPAGASQGVDGTPQITLQRSLPAAAASAVRPLLAASQPQALAVARQRLTTAARRHGTTVSLVETRAAGPALLAFRVDVSGPQSGVLGMAEEIERGAPSMTFANWRLEPAAEGLHLAGALLVPWAAAR